MPSETVPAQTDSAAPAAPAAPSVSEATLQELRSGTKTLKDLDTPTRQAAMAEIRKSVMEADNGAAADTDAEPKPIAKAPETHAAPEPKPEGKGELQAPMSVKERRKLNQQLADDANALEQKTQALLARQERARKAKEDAEKAEVKPEDPWDKDHQDSLATELERTKKRLQILEEERETKFKDELDDAKKSEHTAREKSLYGQFDELQDEYETLKTSKPFKQLNEEYSTWLDKDLVEKSGLRQTMAGKSLEEIRAAAIDRYNKDPEFAKTVAAYPLTGDDADRYNTMLTLHHLTATKGGDLESNWLKMLKTSGQLETVMQKGRETAANDAASRTVKAIQKASNAVQPVAPGDGAGRGYVDEEWNASRARTVQAAMVKKHTSGQALNASERETLKKANAILREEFVGAEQ